MLQFSLKQSVRKDEQKASESDIRRTQLNSQSPVFNPHEKTNNFGISKSHSRSKTESPHQSSSQQVARSHAEQVLFDMTASGEKVNAGKFRQLPCRTFISTGHCPYKDRCVYLHCPSIRSAFPTKLKSKRKNKEDIISDSMFWPIMPYSSDTVESEYRVPRPEQDQYVLHDTYLCSIWEHYKKVCENITLEHNFASLGSFYYAKAKRQLAQANDHTKVNNSHVDRPRLETFRELAYGNSVQVQSTALNKSQPRLDLQYQKASPARLDTDFLEVEKPDVASSIIETQRPQSSAPNNASVEHTSEKYLESPIGVNRVWCSFSPQQQSKSPTSGTLSDPMPMPLPPAIDLPPSVEEHNISKPTKFTFAAHETKTPWSFERSTPSMFLYRDFDSTIDEHTSMDDTELLSEKDEQHFISFIHEDEQDEKEIFNIYEASKKLLVDPSKKQACFTSLSTMLDLVDAPNPQEMLASSGHDKLVFHPKPLRKT